MEQTQKRIETIETIGRALGENSPGSIEWLEAANIAIQIMLKSERERLVQQLEHAK